MLYYPRVNPPRSVIYQALLYWDNISTFQAGGLEPSLSREMQQVRDAGLYEAIDISSGPYSLAGAIIDERDFLAALRSVDLPELSTQLSGDLDYNIGWIPADTDLATEFNRRNLGIRHTTVDGREMWMLDDAPQRMLISLLATKAAGESNLRNGCTGPEAKLPFTDMAAAFHVGYRPFVGQTYLESTAQPTAQPCWQIDIGRLLPIPASEVMISDVLSFRDRHEGERRELMLALDNLVHSLQQNWRHPLDVLNHARSRINSAVEELRAATRATRLQWLTRPLAVSIAIAGASMGSVLHPTQAWPFALTSGVAVNIATSSLRKDPRLPTPFTYLLRVDDVLSEISR